MCARSILLGTLHGFPMTASGTPSSSEAIGKHGFRRQDRQHRKARIADRTPCRRGAPSLCHPSCCRASTSAQHRRAMSGRPRINANPIIHSLERGVATLPHTNGGHFEPVDRMRAGNETLFIGRVPCVRDDAIRDALFSACVICHIADMHDGYPHAMRSPDTTRHRRRCGRASAGCMAVAARPTALAIRWDNTGSRTARASVTPPDSSARNAMA